MEVIFSLHDISEAAQKILACCKDCTALAFHGEMGAGKTTFIHALCDALGISDTVSSPTFSIINQYRTSTGKSVFHMDLYRLKDEQEAINAGVEDHLFSGDLCLVEWPEKAPGIFPDNTIHLYLEVLTTDTRKVFFKK